MEGNYEVAVDGRYCGQCLTVVDRGGKWKVRAVNGGYLLVLSRKVSARV